MHNCRAFSLGKLLAAHRQIVMFLFSIWMMLCTYCIAICKTAIVFLKLSGEEILRISHKIALDTTSFVFDWLD